MPKTFAEVYDIYNKVDPNMDLPAFSRYANELTGSQDFSEGQGNWLGNTLRKGSYWLDKGLEYTGLPELTGDLGRSIFETFGANPEGGYEVGKALPRGFVDMAPMFIPGAPELQGARLVGAGLASAFHTFGDTGSVARSAVSGFTPFAMGKAGQMAGEGLLKTGLLNPVTELVEGGAQKFLTTTGDKVMNYLGSEMAANAAGELINYSQEAIAQGTLNPYEGMSLKDKALEMVIGNLPYMIGDVPHLLRGGKVAVGDVIRKLNEAKADVPLPDLDISQTSDESAAEMLANLKHMEAMHDSINEPDHASMLAKQEALRKQHEIEIAAIRSPKAVTPDSSPLTRLKRLDELEREGLYDPSFDAPVMEGQPIEMDESGQPVLAQPNPENLPNWIRIKRAEMLDQMPHHEAEDVTTPEQLADIVDETKTLSRVEAPKIEEVVEPERKSRADLAREQVAALRAQREERLSERSKLDVTPEEVQQTLVEEAIQDRDDAIDEARTRLKEKEYADSTMTRKKDLALWTNEVKPTTGRTKFETREEAQAFADSRNATDKNKDYHYDVRQRKGNLVVAKVFHTEEARGTHLASRRAEAKRAAIPEIGTVAQEVANLVSKKAETPEERVVQSQAKVKLSDFIREHNDVLGLTPRNIEQMGEMLASKTVTKDQLLKGLQERLEQIHHEQSQETLLPSPAEGETVPTRSVLEQLKGQAMPTNREVLDNLLRRGGHSEADTKTFGDFLEKIVDQFSIPGLKLGEIHNEHSEAWVRGLAHKTKNSVWLAAFGKQGSPFTKARDLGTVLAHELGHVVDEITERGGLRNHRVGKADRDLKAAIKADEALASQEGRNNKFHDLVTEWVKTLPPAYRDLPAFRDMLSSQRPEEIYANMQAAWAAGDFGQHEANAFGVQAPVQARTWAKEMSAFASTMFKNLKALVWKNGEEALPNLKPSVKAMIEHFDSVATAMRDAEVQLKEMDRLVGLGRDTSWANQELWNITTKDAEKLESGWKLKDLNYMKSAPEESDVVTIGKIPSVIQELGQTLGTLISRVPVFRRAGAAIYDTHANRTKLANQALAPTQGGLTETGMLSTNSKEAAKYGQVTRGQNESLNKLVSAIGQHMQQTPDIAWSLENYTKNPQKFKLGGVEMDLQARVNALSDKDKQALDHFFASAKMAHQAVGKGNIEALHETTRNYMSIMLGKALPVERWSQAPELVRRLTDAAEEAMALNPTEKLIGAKKLDAVQKMIGDDDTFATMLQTWLSTRADTQKLAELYAKSPGHLSNIRTGRFQVEARKGEDRISDLIENKEDYEEWKKDKQKAGFTDFIPPQLVPERFRVKADDDMLGVLQQLQDKIAKQIETWDVDQDIKEVMLRDTDVLGGVSRLMAAKDLGRTAGMKGLASGERRLTHGTMDMVQSQENYYRIMAAHNATKVGRSRLAFELTNPELKRFPDHTAKFKRQVENYFTPDSSLTRGLMELNATWHLGGSLPAMITNAIQPMMTATSEVINRGVGTVKATMMTNSAIKDASKLSLHLLKNKVGFGKDKSAFDAIKDPEERAMLNQLVQDGHMTIGASEISDPTADAAINLNYFSGTGKRLKPWDKAKSVVNSLKNASMKGFVATEQHNMRVSALLGWRTQKELMGKAFDPKVAYEKTKEFIRDTTYSGGRMNRPLVQGDNGAIGAMAYSLQGYTLGWLGQMARYIQHGFSGEHLNLTPEQKKNARKAAMHFMGVQAGAAGLMGMPFVAAAMKILEEATGEDITGNTYEKLGQLLDQDGEEGYGLANTVMNGAANGLLANAGVPIDMGSRWTIGGALGFNGYDGFDGDAVWGPTGGLVSSALTGLKSVFAGDITGAVKGFSPTGIKKALQYAINGDVQQTNGESVGASNVEKMAYIAGFNPQSLSNLQKLKSLKYSSDRAMQQDQMKQTADILDTLKKDPEDAKRKLIEQSVQSQGLDMPKAIAARVATKAAEAAFPYDPRAQATKKSSAHLIDMARTLGVEFPEAQLVARRQYMNEIMQMLGQSGVRVTPQLMRKERSMSPF